MTFKDKVMLYFIRKSNTLDKEYDENLQYYRYRNNDEVEYLECIIRKVRRDFMNEILKDIFSIVNTQDREQFKALQNLKDK